MTVHHVDINVTANTKGAEKSLTYLQELMGQFGKNAAGKFAGLLGAAAVAKMAFDKVSEAISKNIQTAKQVSSMAIKFNIDPRAMHSITLAANDAQVSVRALTMAMKQLGKMAERGISTKDMKINFEQLGVSAEKLAEIQAKPSKFLPEIAKALMEIGDENQRAAAGAMLFGRQYQQILPLIEELGESQEEREKFLDNENAMTAEQIAQNKEISKIQNELSDNFEKMVAAAAPLLNWAMNFVNFLAQGLGFLKDMIFESEKARKEREKKAESNVTRKIAAYQQDLERRSQKDESGKDQLTDAERSEIQAAGGVTEYIAKNAAALAKKTARYKIISDYQSQHRLVRGAKEAASGIVYGRPDDIEYLKTENPELYAYYKAMDEERADQAEERAGRFTVSEEMQRRLGVHFSQRGTDYTRGGLRRGTDGERQNDIFRQNLTELFTASEGSYSEIARLGSEEALKRRRREEAEAEKGRRTETMGRYTALRKSQAAILGQFYDEATDKVMSRYEYEQLQKSRGASDEEISLSMRTFEDEKERRKAEKLEKKSVRQLTASERKLFVGDPGEGKLKTDLTEEDKALEAIADSYDTINERAEDWMETTADLQELEAELSNAKNASDKLRIEGLIATKRQEQRQQQILLNQAVGENVALQEQLRKIKEKEYFEDLKRTEEAKKQVEIEEDHANSLKYRLMKSEGASKEEIDTEKLMDEQMKLKKMMDDYVRMKKEFETNAVKGEGGQALDEREIEKLKSLTANIEAQRRQTLDLALELGNQQGRGVVSDMRRIGGGGMEYGGLASTAKQQLEQQKKMVAHLQAIAGYFGLNPRGLQTSALGKDGKPLKGQTFSEVSIFGADRPMP